MDSHLLTNIAIHICKRVLSSKKLDLIAWKMFCDLARLRIAYCPSVHVWHVWHLLLADFKVFLAKIVWTHCQFYILPMSIPSQIAVDCKSVHYLRGKICRECQRTLASLASTLLSTLTGPDPSLVPEIWGWEGDPLETSHHVSKCQWKHE